VTLLNKLQADRAPVAQDQGQRPAIPILALPANLYRPSVEQFPQPIPRQDSPAPLVLALAVQLWRIDVGNADAFALDDEAIPIVHACDPDARWRADREGDRQEGG